jgi:NAD(P)-dependent dehydrogenase (short-subunit alcohol dehydrogenase family)
MLREGFRDAPDAFAQLGAAHPQGRVGDPGEVARLALAIASGDFGFLHGACIGIDGGILGRLHDPV